MIKGNNIGIEQISSCINVCQVSRELLKTEDKGSLEGHGKRNVSKKCRETRDITCQMALFAWIIMMMKLKVMFSTLLYIVLNLDFGSFCLSNMML